MNVSALLTLALTQVRCKWIALVDTIVSFHQITVAIVEARGSEALRPS